MKAVTTRARGPIHPAEAALRDTLRAAAALVAALAFAPDQAIAQAAEDIPSPEVVARMTDHDRLDQILADLEGRGAPGLESLAAILSASAPQSSARHAVLGAMGRAGEDAPLRAAELLEDILRSDPDRDPAVLRCYADVVPYLDDALSEARQPIYAWMWQRRSRRFNSPEWKGEGDRLDRRRCIRLASLTAPDVEKLFEADTSWHDRELAADWCRMFPSEAAPLIPRLRQELRSRVERLGYAPQEARLYSFSRAEIRVRLALALLAVDAQGEDRAMALTVLLRLHESPRVRRAAALQLCEIPSPESIAQIVTALRGECCLSVVESIASAPTTHDDVFAALDAARRRIQGWPDAEQRPEPAAVDREADTDRRGK